MTAMQGHGGPRRRIFLAGDSTVITRGVDYLPMAGWGQMLQLFFTPDVEVVNCARAGASSMSFFNRGRFQWILDNVSPGDYVVITFGQVDYKPGKGLYAGPHADYQLYLRTMVEMTREHQAHPVLVMTHERRKFDKHDNLIRYITTYPMAMREVAAETSAPLIDLYAQSLEWWQDLGPDASRDLFTHLRQYENPLANIKGWDDTHCRAEGCTEFARFVARAMRDQGLIPAHQVTGLERTEFTAEEMGWVSVAVSDQRAKERVSPPTEDAKARVAGAVLAPSGPGVAKPGVMK
ncbi:rhamnogalacturonan acetylesterase [Streptomyces sp. NPDC089919]|uniref:rhamnogalacturonan acetylesterase n=1 Tax=Streptomyces sp. NPDC089919 TaxID=3155188 RepID=UPI00343EC97C